MKHLISKRNSLLIVFVLMFLISYTNLINAAPAASPAVSTPGKVDPIPVPPKAGHLIAAIQNCPTKNCAVFNANGESETMDMQGKTLATLTTGDMVVIKGQTYRIEGAPQIFITGGNLVSSGGREQFAIVHITTGPSEATLEGEVQPAQSCSS